MASTPPKVIIKTVTRIHIFLYRISGGKIWSRMAGLPVLLLTTTGRKSGQPRTTPVVYHRDGDDYLIVASNGGFDPHPAWYYNLEATPEVRVEVGDQAFDAQARITEGDMRNQHFETFKSSSPNFILYERRAQRTIPVIRLTPHGN